VTTPAEELRAAAARWRTTHPDDGLAHALADLLGALADDADMCDRINNRRPADEYATRVMYAPATTRALAVARLINQEPS
jgi:hypothetical protein